MTFGDISLKINIKKVVMRVPAIITPSSSPYNWTAITVTRVAEAALQKLLHNKITLNNLSVSARSLVAKIAPFFPILVRCFNLYRLMDIRLVSAMEKKAEIISKTAKRIN